MKRIGSQLLSLAVCLAVGLGIAGCKKSAAPVSASEPSDGGAAASAVADSADAQPAGSGVICGKVFFDSASPPPVMHSIDTKGLVACNHDHRQLLEEYAIVNSNKTLKNVLVYLKDAPAGGGGGTLPPVFLDQAHCQFVPHIVALRVGQRLVIRNSDDAMHNINGQARVNPAFNFAQAKVGDQATKIFKAAEIFSVTCDVHPWMKAYVGVFANGYFALTGDDGTFAIANVPAGQYTLIAWHEHYGKLNQSVLAEDDKTTQADLTYKE